MPTKLEFFYSTAEDDEITGALELWVNAPGAASGHVHDALAGYHDEVEGVLRAIQITPDVELPQDPVADEPNKLAVGIH